MARTLICKSVRVAPKETPGSSTPATLALDRALVPYTLHPYVHHESARHYGEEAAEQLGVAPTTIFKTLVVDSGTADRGRQVGTTAGVDHGLGRTAWPAASAGTDRFVPRHRWQLCRDHEVTTGLLELRRTCP